MNHVPKAMIAIAVFAAICGSFIIGFGGSGAAEGEYRAYLNQLDDANACNIEFCDGLITSSDAGDDASDIVATIDGKDYYTFKEAVAAAKLSPTKGFTLLSDIDLTTEMDQYEYIDVTELTINLGGKTVKTGTLYGILTGTDFILRNGIVDGQGASYGLWVGDNPETENVEIEDITVYGGINLFHAENIVLKDVTAEGIGYYAVWCDEGANVIIESGGYSSASSMTTALLGISGTLASMSIVGGTFEVAEGKFLVLGGDYADPVITGGTFINISARENLDDYVAEGYKATQSSAGTYVVDVNLDLSISVENNRRGKTMLQAIPSTAATLDESRTVVEWAFEGRHYSDEAKIIPTKSGLYTVTVTVYDEKGTSGTATAEYQFDYVHTVTLKLPDGTEETFTVPHNGTIANLPTPGKLHYSYIWTDAHGSKFKAADKVNRDLVLTATLVMSDISVDISYIREDGKVYVKATCSPAVKVEGIECTWAIDGSKPMPVDRVELTEKDRHYRFEMNGKTSDGTLARAVWEDDLCMTTDASTTIETDKEKVSFVSPDTSKTAIDQTIDFNMPDIAEDEKVTISIKGTITDTRSIVDVSVEDIINSGYSWTDGMSAAVDVSVSNVDSGYSLTIIVRVQIPDDYLGAVAYFYNEASSCLEMVDSTIDETTGLVTIYTDHNTPYMVQVLTKENPDPVVPDTPDVPLYDADDDDYYPVYPTVTDGSKKDDSKAAVACVAAGVVAALMAAYLVTDSRKSR